MSRARPLITFCIATLLLATAVAVAPGRARRGDDAPPVAPLPADAATLVERLGDANYAVRRDATDALWKLRAAAIPALERAAASADPEVAARARLLLQRLRLGIEPDVPPDVIPLAVRARDAVDPAARTAARQRLANAPTAAAPVIAQLVIDAVAGDASVRDPAELVLRDLWPSDRWGMTCLATELARRGERTALLAWLERIAVAGNAVTAAPHLAYVARDLGELEPLIARWEERTAAQPSLHERRALACLLFAADDARADDVARAMDPTSVVPIAWALLKGDDARAAALAAEHPDEPTRVALALLLARVAGAETTVERALEGQIAAWLVDEAPALRAAFEAGGRDAEKTLRARRGLLSALLVGDVTTAFELADLAEPSSLLRALYRRMEFEQAQALVQRRADRADPDNRAVRTMYARMASELRSQNRRADLPSDLSSFAARRLEASAALRAGDAASAAVAFGALVEADPADPALLWAAGTSQQAAGRDGGNAVAALGRFAPLSDGWVRRGLADEMWHAGDRAGALAEYAEAAKWATLVTPDTLAALEALAARLGKSGEHAQAQRVLVTAQVLLFERDVYDYLASLERGVYYACYAGSEVERARMNLAAGAGDWAGAEAAWLRGQALLPQTEASIELIAALDAAGERRTADRLFIESYTPLLMAIKSFETSSMLNNQAAWLAASVGRRLDTALNQAQTAVMNDTGSPAAADTLAEVHFRRGEFARARELAERAVVLAEVKDAESGLPIGQLGDYAARRDDFLRRLADAGHVDAPGDPTTRPSGAGQ